MDISSMSYTIRPDGLVLAARVAVPHEFQSAGKPDGLRKISRHLKVIEALREITQ